MPPRLVRVPERAAVASQTASASRRVLVAIARVAGRFNGLVGPLANAATGWMYGFARGHVCAGTEPARSHLRRASCEQSEGSVVKTAWPTPGTTTRCPC